MSAAWVLVLVLAILLAAAVVAIIWLAVKRKPAAPHGSADTSDGATRHVVTLVVLLAGAVGIVTLGALVIVVSTPATRPDNVRLVFGAVLPLLASWVGTVLAYYYSRENLTAATRSVTDLAKEITGTQKLAAIPVTKAMIARDQIKTLYQPSGPAASYAEIPKLKLTEVLSRLQANNVQRLPIWDDSKVMQFMVHRSKITDFIVDKVSKAPDLTMNDLLTDPTLSAMFKSTFVVVGIDATLADAKARMDAVPSCEDVFVTRTGQPSEPIEGWLPDNEIAKAAKL